MFYELPTQAACVKSQTGRRVLICAFVRGGNHCTSPVVCRRLGQGGIFMGRVQYFPCSCFFFCGVRRGRLLLLECGRTPGIHRSCVLCFFRRLLLLLPRNLWRIIRSADCIATTGRETERQTNRQAVLRFFLSCVKPSLSVFRLSWRTCTACGRAPVLRLFYLLYV